jgi:hypothetical protein
MLFVVILDEILFLIYLRNALCANGRISFWVGEVLIWTGLVWGGGWKAVMDIIVSFGLLVVLCKIIAFLMWSNKGIGDLDTVLA